MPDFTANDGFLTRFDADPALAWSDRNTLAVIAEALGHDVAIFGYSPVVFTRPQTDTRLVSVANESTDSTTPTLTVVRKLVKALYPDQLT